MKTSKEEISHDGVIVDITPEFTTVEIVSESACSSCHASALCGISESKKKAVQVPTTPGNWHPGQRVSVNLKRSMGLKAVWLSYVVPLFVLLAVLLGLSALGIDELICGLAGIGAVAVYYLFIYIFRDKLRNEYSFYIREK